MYSNKVFKQTHWNVARLKTMGYSKNNKYSACSSLLMVSLRQH